MEESCFQNNDMNLISFPSSFIFNRKGYSSLIDLSYNNLSKAELTMAERELLFSLDFYLHPPTSVSFIRHFLEVMIYSCTPEEYRMRLDMFTYISNYSSYQTELAVFDEDMASCKPSYIALSAIRKAIQSLLLDNPSGIHISSSNSSKIQMNSYDKERLVNLFRILQYELNLTNKYHLFHCERNSAATIQQCLDNYWGMETNKSKMFEKKIF